MAKRLPHCSTLSKAATFAAENHKVVVYAAERRAPMHRTGTN